jgi:hypothetical protein
MEENNPETTKGNLPSLAVTASESASLDIIRTETVLSRLPVHNLARKGSISIQILKKTDSGEIELLWRVSPSRDYGEPRQLAYKLDTIIINQRIDEAGRPLPKLLRLGSLNDICGELGLTKDHGTNSKNIKNAFLQNALTGITAKFSYRANDGAERRLEAGFTRYSVIFTGEKLPDGRKADAVYVMFNEPFWEVLNNAPVRPLDRAYMKQLPPAAQRFYEIISRKIFAALKNNYPRAKITYSEYCTFSAQLRHFERQPVQDQMAKVLRPHKASGYITGVKYESTIDAQNQPDWIMFLTPGPKAHAEFALAHGGRKARKMIEAGLNTTGDQPSTHRRTVPPQQRIEQPAPPSFDPQLIVEFSRRGVTEKKARALLANLKPGQAVLAQLELGDHHIAKDPAKYTNPAGFYIHLVEENTPIPIGFETNSQRKAREEAERRRDDERRAQQELEYDYEDYRNAEIDHYIATVDPAEMAVIEEVKMQEMKDKHQSPWIIESFAKHDVRRELAKRAPLMTIEEFAARRRQGSGVTWETAIEATSLPANQESPRPVPNEPLSDQSSPAIAANTPTNAEEGNAAIEPLPQTATNPAIADPAAPLISYPPPPEPGADSVESQFA